MRFHGVCITLAVSLAATCASGTRASAAEDAPVRFDLAPLAAAIPDPDQPTLVTVPLRLSSMIESAKEPDVDQWLVRCQMRDRAVSIADYAPRTLAASDLETPIQVKSTEEENRAYGLSLDGAYGHAVQGNAGMDHAKKKINTTQFDRAAPLQAVTASGTINRGRGVYFKLRWTAKQVLEGEKTFRLTLRVPAGWRGGLMDVSVMAQSGRKSLWEHETKTIAAEHFVVAVYRQGDEQAAERARLLSEAEYALRAVAASYQVDSMQSLPSMLRHVARKLDLESKHPDQRWLARLLHDRADPHLDKEISKLPMPLRVAVLDYADLRDEFGAINGDVSGRISLAKPAME